MKINNINSAYNFNGMPPHGQLSPSDITQVQGIQAKMKDLIDKINNAQGKPENDRINDIRQAQQDLTGMQSTMNNLLASNPQGFSQAAPDCISDLGYCQRDLNTLIANPNSLQAYNDDMKGVISRLQHFLGGGDY